LLDTKRKAEEASLTFLIKENEEMQTLPKRMRQVLRHFETAMSERVWEGANVLLIGAILAPGERTVAAIVRVMGCSDEKPFQKRPSGAQSCEMVESRTQPSAAVVAGTPVLCRKCATDHGHR
jgi:hypothetical protein